MIQKAPQKKEGELCRKMTEGQKQRLDGQVRVGKTGRDL